jgi:23S rRNA (uracil1939-C5)-methyltransferase
MIRCIMTGRNAFRIESRGSRMSQGQNAVPCPHYPQCLGCPFIGLPYREQLLRKRQIVARAFAAFPSLVGLEVPPVIASPRRLGYRARVKLVVRRTQGEVAAGLYVPKSHRVIDISSCPVHPRPVNQVIQYLKRKVQDLDIAAYDARDDSGDLRYLDFRYSFARRDLSVTLVTRHRTFPRGMALARALRRKFSFVSGVIQNINEGQGNVIWGNIFRSLAGSGAILEQIGNLRLIFPAGVFSQVNPFTSRKLYERIYEIAGLKGGETVLDLYCGVGPISLSLAAAARQIWAIDESELSIIAAKQNARRNGIGNCRFFIGDVAEKLLEVQRQVSGVDLAVLNPPRKGIQPTALPALLAVNAGKIVYVSCDPRSLARDLDRLIAAGYTVRWVQPFDMFPQTEGVETAVLLRKS